MGGMEKIGKNMEKHTNETAEAVDRIVHFNEIKAANEAEAVKLRSKLETSWIYITAFIKAYGMVLTLQRVGVYNYQEWWGGGAHSAPHVKIAFRTVLPFSIPPIKCIYKEGSCNLGAL